MRALFHGERASKWASAFARQIRCEVIVSSNGIILYICGRNLPEPFIWIVKELK